MERKFNSEDEQRKKLIVTTMVIGSIFLLFGLTCTITYNALTEPNFSGSMLYVVPAVLFAHVIFLILLKRGFVHSISIVLIGIYLIGAIYGSYTWGVSMPMTLLLFALIINISTILFNIRFGICMTIFIFLVILILGFRESSNPIIASWKNDQADMADIFAYMTILFISAGLSAISQRETLRSLERARNSEKSLREISQVAEFGKIAKGLFHDLISPLSSISLYIESVKENPQKAKEAHEYINKAIKVTERMREMIQVIKNNIRSTNLIQRFSVLDEINTAKDLLEKRAYQSNIQIDLSKTRKEFIIGNPLRFHQVIYNLISNAIDAHESFVRTDRRIEIKNWQQNNEIHVEISDNGPGIPNHHIKKIFDPSFTTKKDHFGIGLSTAKEIIDKEFNGKLSVTSKIGFGTTFILSIPVYENRY